MPIFDYVCKKCGENFTILIKNIKETDKVPDCPNNCGIENIKRIYGMPAVHMKHGNCGTSKDGYSGNAGNCNPKPKGM